MIVIVATLANIGVVPTFANAPPVYGHLLSVGAPVSIFLLLLNVHLAALAKAGGPSSIAPTRFGLIPAAYSLPTRKESKAGKSP